MSSKVSKRSEDEYAFTVTSQQHGDGSYTFEAHYAGTLPFIGGGEFLALTQSSLGSGRHFAVLLTVAAIPLAIIGGMSAGGVVQLVAPEIGIGMAILGVLCLIVGMCWGFSLKQAMLERGRKELREAARKMIDAKRARVPAPSFSTAFQGQMLPQAFQGNVSANNYPGASLPGQILNVSAAAPSLQAGPTFLQLGNGMYAMVVDPASIPLLAAQYGAANEPQIRIDA
jgi:type II secretory pathway pseudopilin PulG